MIRTLKFIIAIVLAFTKGIYVAPTRPLLCNDSVCLRSAERMRSFMNFNAKPCDDFYEYACGNYSKKKKLPPDSDVINMNEELIMEVQKNIIAFLNQRNEWDPTAVKKAKSFFGDCTNIESLENFGYLPLAISLKNMNLPLKPPFIGPLENPLPEFSTAVATVRQHMDLNFPFRIVVAFNRKNKLYNQLEIRTPLANILSKIKLKFTTADQSTDPTKPSPSTVKEDSPEKSAAALSNSRSIRKSAVLDESEKPTNSLPKTKVVTPNPNNLKKQSVADGETQSKSGNVKKRDASPKPELNNMKPGQEKSNESASTNAETEGQSKPNDKNKKSDDESKPLAEYMAKVVDAMYKYTNNKLVDHKVDFLRNKIDEISHIIHSVEKLVANTNPNEDKSGEFTIEELQKTTDLFSMHQSGKPVIDWYNLIATLYNNDETVTDQFKSGELKVFVENMDYLQHAIKFLAAVNERSLYSVLWWTVVRHYIVDTTQEARTWEEEYRKSVGLKVESRDERCMKSAVDVFDFAAAYIYIQDVSVAQGINMMESVLIPNLDKTTIRYIKTLPDFDTQTKMAAIHKYTNIVIRSGYDPALRSPVNLNKKYQTTVQIKGSYYFSRMMYDRRSIKTSLERVNKKNENLPRRYPSPLASKVEYSIQENIVYVPVALLKFPALEHPVMALNFGTLVSALARAEYLAIHLKGSEYNAFGVQTNWWEPAAVQKYNERIKYFSDELSKLPYEKFNTYINGPAAVPALIADLISFEFSTLSYSWFMRSSLSERKLVKFEHFSPFKLVALMWAQSICENETDERSFNILKRGTSLPAAVRIREAVKYTVNFPFIWHCSERKP